MGLVSRKYPKNIAGKQGEKPMTDDPSMSSNDGGPSEGNQIIEDLVI